MRVSKEVQTALKQGKPVVCLETTIISHGMPFPRNVETALNVEDVIRANGAIPATIGIINGEAVIGMSREEINEFGTREGIYKASRADLPMIFAKKLWASTTVSATMILAEAAGIEIFVTGGIGGVHRDYLDSFDLSTDLEELARTNVTVISSGVKSILDIGHTLEYLETKGVPVIGYKTEQFPSFFSQESGYKLNYKLDDSLEAANVIKAKRDARLSGGILIANPVPKEHALDHKEIDQVIAKALKLAKKEKITGKEVTPFLLSKVNELSGGRSLEANIALILDNARVGAQIAVSLSGLK